MKTNTSGDKLSPLAIRTVFFLFMSLALSCGEKIQNDRGEAGQESRNQEIQNNLDAAFAAGESTLFNVKNVASPSDICNFVLTVIPKAGTAAFIPGCKKYYENVVNCGAAAACGALKSPLGTAIGVYQCANGLLYSYGTLQKDYDDCYDAWFAIVASPSSQPAIAECDKPDWAHPPQFWIKSYGYWGSNSYAMNDWCADNAPYQTSRGKIFERVYKHCGDNIPGPYQGSDKANACKLSCMKNSANMVADQCYRGYGILTVSKSGSGTGQVTSSPAGIDCGSSCSMRMNTSQPIVLTATPSQTSTFVRWTSGWALNPCVGSHLDSTCEIKERTSHTVTAEFRIKPSVSLSLSSIGSGSGTISPCSGTSCSIAYPQGSVVTLTANAGSESFFAGWSGGGCSGNAQTCTVTMDQSKTVTANFLLSPRQDQSKFALTATKAGTGLGTVGIDSVTSCSGNTCTGLFLKGTKITLTATANPGSVFAGWIGHCTGTAGTCQVTMDGARWVSAIFNLIPVTANYTLQVSKTGTGAGTVSGPGINCGTDCSETKAGGSYITLTAVASPGSSFAGWSKAECGTGTSCSFVVNSNISVQARFNGAVSAYSLSVFKDGNGQGTVSSNIGGINCGNTCSAIFSPNSIVTLTASPQPSSSFTGWSGACYAVNSPTCNVTINGSKTVTATFAGTPNMGQAQLVVKIEGLGNVTSYMDSGINCGTVCQWQYPINASVYLWPSPYPGFRFVKWIGPCVDRPGSDYCEVAMNSSKSITAVFERN